MRLREILLRSHAVDAGVLSQAEQMSAATGAPVVHILVRYQIVEGRWLARLLSRAAHVELIDVAAIDIHRRLLEVVPRHAAERLRVLPIGVKRTAAGERLYLAMADPTDDGVVDVVEKATGRTVEPMCLDDDALSRSLDRHYGPPAPVVDDEPAVLVGVLDRARERALEAGGEFLTESTAEALRLVQTVRSNDLPQLSPVDVGDGDIVEGVDDETPTLELTRQQRPASIALANALAEVTADVQRGGPRSLPTMQEVWGQASATAATTLEPLRSELPISGERSAVDLAPDEELFDSPTTPSRAAVPGAGVQTTVAAKTTTMAKPAMDPPSILPNATARVFVSTPQGVSSRDRAALHEELLDLFGQVELDDDAVAACRNAVRGRALVLLAPRPQSALLRALLDLEERQPRPRIVILGGDPSLRMLAFVDHHADMPDMTLGARAVGVAVMVALRQVGVRL